MFLIKRFKLPTRMIHFLTISKVSNTITCRNHRANLLLTSNITPYRSGLDLLPPSLATIRLTGTVELFPLVELSPSASAPIRHVASKTIDVARPAHVTDSDFMTS